MNISRTIGFLIGGTVALSTLLHAEPVKYTCPEPDKLKWDLSNLQTKVSWKVTAEDEKSWSTDRTKPYTDTRHPSNPPDHDKIHFEIAKAQEDREQMEQVLTCVYTVANAPKLELIRKVTAAHCTIEGKNFACQVYQPLKK